MNVGFSRTVIHQCGMFQNCNEPLGVGIFAMQWYDASSITLSVVVSLQIEYTDDSHKRWFSMRCVCVGGVLNTVIGYSHQIATSANCHKAQSESQKGWAAHVGPLPRRTELDCTCRTTSEADSYPISHFGVFLARRTASDCQISSGRYFQRQQSWGMLFKFLTKYTAYTAMCRNDLRDAEYGFRTWHSMV